MASSNRWDDNRKEYIDDRNNSWDKNRNGWIDDRKKNKREQEWIVDDRNDRLDKNRDGSKYMIERMDEMRIGTDW